MSDDRGPVHRFEPYADHLVFVIADAEATEGVSDRATWDRAAEDRRIAVERHAVVVGTARCDFVPVVLAVREQPPARRPWMPSTTSSRQTSRCRRAGWR